MPHLLINCYRATLLRTALLCLLLPITLSCTATAKPKVGFGEYTVQPAYTETVKESFYVTLRDGVDIAVAIVRPAKNGKPVNGKFPVIWHHTLSISREERDGTGGFISDLHAIPTLAQHGYVVAQVARRGNGQSYGVMRGYHDRNEAQDAYELTQWFSAQSWSDGKVGIYGCSNTGDAAMHAMSVRPPALKAVFAGCFSWHKYDAFRRGAIFAQWGTGPARTLQDDLAIPAVSGDESKERLLEAAQEHQLATPLLNMWAELPFRDSWSKTVGSRFWSEGSAVSYLDQIQRSDVALYVMGGWFDELRDQGLYTFMNVPNTKVIMGPWQHCRNGDFPLLAEIHRFFDYHLKGVNTGINDDPAIHYYVMDSQQQGHWESTNSWPLTQTQEQTLYFGDKVLSEKSQQPVASTITIQPETACPGESISARSQPCVTHPSSLRFKSEPVTDSLEITGHPVVSAWVKVNSNDANVFAYLEDIAPDGTVTVITEGRLKASMRKTARPTFTIPDSVPWHRHFARDQALLTPGEPVRLDFDLMPSSWELKPGHSVALTITGSDYRERLREPVSSPVSLTVLSGGEFPSTLTLPVIPSSSGK